MSQAVFPVAIEAQSPAWRLNWLTTRRCHLLLAAILLLGFLGHLRYILHDCPLDLAGDEAHYWDWSRQLDISYYSKGPVVAYLIRASCAIFGDTMPAVRFPALLLAVGTSLLTYWLTAKLFGSFRVALGAVLLNHLVPMFIAGSVMMTIDPPFFFCWAAATCFGVKAVFDGRQWAWIGVGVAVGIGFLAKFAMPLWIVGFAIFALTDRQARKQLATGGPWFALAIALLLSSPVLVFNAQHGWVSVKHVSGDAGLGNDDDMKLGRWAQFLGGQLAALGPGLVVIILGAMVYAFRQPSHHPHARPLRLLVWLGIAYWVLTATTVLRKEPQVNWFAPAYFTLIILAAHFLSTRLADRRLWRPWRLWFYMAVATAVVATPILHDVSIIYPVVERARAKFGFKPKAAIRWDPTARLRGWKELGQRVSDELSGLSNPMVLGQNYQQASELAFYVRGQPRTYYVGSWIPGEKRMRASQFDLWPDRRLDRPELLGRDGIFVGNAPCEEFRKAWRSVKESLPVLDVYSNGVRVRTFHVYRCEGFKGMKDPGIQTKH